LRQAGELKIEIALIRISHRLEFHDERAEAPIGAALCGQRHLHRGRG
jgi:hypothetical protein